ncbi:MAG: peptide deformylase [Planctomycetota bacterium]
MELVLYPDPILRKRAAEVETIDDALRERVAEMFEVMYREHGVGLAAPQVGWGVRLFVMNALGPDAPDEGLVFINPKIVKTEGGFIDEEGCLSIPDVRGNVERSFAIEVEAVDENGQEFRAELEDLAARVVQHEYDHLDGILFTSRLSPAEKLRIRAAMKRMEKDYKKRQQEGGRG